jgi:hypothetical protein
VQPLVGAWSRNGPDLGLVAPVRVMLRLQRERVGRDGVDGWLPGRWHGGSRVWWWTRGTVQDRAESDAPASSWPQQARLPAQRASAAAEKKARKAELVARQTLVSDLSRDFSTMVYRLRPAPWIQSATVDPSSYLPVVGNVSFESLQADGGGVTCIKVATTGSWPLLRACGALGLLA